MGKVHKDMYVIRSGAYLNAYCPECRKTLNDDNSVVFNIVNKEDDKGELRLSPYLNVYNNESTVRIPKNLSLKDISCPQCGTSLIEKDKKCPECDSWIAGIDIEAMHRMVRFYFCSVRGCRWHGLNDEVIRELVLQDSNEW